MNKLKFVFITLIFILITNYISTLSHEYAHSFVAWFLGWKENPLALNYGGTSLENLFLLFHIDENINYNLIISQGRLCDLAFIAFSGIGIGNGLPYFLTLFLLNRNFVQQNSLIYYFVFWFNFMSCANFYSYIPIRVFAHHADMANFTKGLNISSWWVYFIGGYFVLFTVWYFFTRVLIKAFVYLDFKMLFSQASLLITCVIILFGYFGMVGFLDYGEISHFLSVTSFMLIPGMIVACWPTHSWVRYQLANIKK